MVRRILKVYRPADLVHYGKRDPITQNKLRRREFLDCCGQAAAIALVPACLGGAETPGSPDVEFHLHPHYREQTQLEPVLRKRAAGADDFVTERYHDAIAAILWEWSTSLLAGTHRTRAMEKVLTADFRAAAFGPRESKIVRSGPLLRVRQLSFSPEPSLGREAFPGELESYLSDLSQIFTAEFQVTAIKAGPNGELATQVRYELVGTGDGFHREQRVGVWDLEWQAATTDQYRLRRWQGRSETRSRSESAMYVDVAQHAFGGNRSYSEQLLHGVDYWRTVLDGASGIDIYGHNGVSVGDIDGDGRDDVYICQPAGLPNRLYRNHGDGTFEDVTEGSGVGLLENTACALFADFNNDGRQHLVVVRANGPLLFLNDGKGKFRTKPDAFQFANVPQGTFTGAAAADYDRDGWLDIYFCLYVYYQGAGQYKYPTPYYDANNGPPNFLMRNNRNGTFTDATAQAGLNRNNTRYSFCCGWTDANGDGWPDLYVANDFGRKNLYRNNGDGTFADMADDAGVQDIGAGMSVCCFDYDNDGAEDIYVADMWTAAGERIAGQESFRRKSSKEVRALYSKHAMGNSLFKNEGNGSFEDQTAAAGVGMGRWSWSSDTWDFDHDGFADLYITNGMVSGPLREDLNSFFWRQVVANSPDEAKPSQRYEQGWTAINELMRADYSWSGFERNVFYANNRDGTFCDVSGAIGLNFVEDGRAFALADFDQDGRLEVLLKNRNGPQLRLLKNVVKNLPPSLCFRLRGTKSNRDAIGAAITVETSQGKQRRLLQAGSGFLSQHSKDVFFGLGESEGPIRASIRWPSGLVQQIQGLLPNYRIFVEEGMEPHRSEPFRPQGETPVMIEPQEGEALPSAAETWLLAPVRAPDFPLRDGDGTRRTPSHYRGRRVLLYLCTNDSINGAAQRKPLEGIEVLAVPLSASDDAAAVYNILYRWLFDRHRDLSLPTSLLINEQGEIVKIYQGPLNLDQVRRDCGRIPNSVADRMRQALPFAGDGGTFTFGRNYLSLGSVYFQRGYLEQAEAAFQLALRDDGASAEAHYGLGSVYLKQAKHSEAQTSFEQAVRLPSGYPDTKPNAWNNLGLLATRERRNDDAIGYFKEALRLDPHYLIALENLGNAYRQAKRWEEARRTLERALAAVPDDPEANYSLGMVFAQTDEPDRAYACLQKALQLRPNYPEAMNNLGVLYLRTRRRDEAVAEFEAAMRVAPEFNQSYLNLARVYLIEGDREKARATLLALLKQHPDDAQGKALLAGLK